MALTEMGRRGLSERGSGHHANFATHRLLHAPTLSDNVDYVAEIRLNPPCHCANAPHQHKMLGIGAAKSDQIDGETAPNPSQD